MANEVKIVVTSEDKTKLDAITKKFSALKDVGEKITGIGARLTGLFTAPILGIGALISQNEKLQASLQPIKDAFAGIIAQLAESLIPVIQDLTPAILGIAKSIADVVKAFAALDVSQKENILKWVMIVAAIGPVIAILGQVLWFVGTLGQLMPILTAQIWATVAPIVAVAAAIFALIKLVQMDEFKKVAALLYGEIGVIATGDATRGRLATASAYKALGGGQAGGEDTGNMIRGLVTAPQANTGGGGTTIVYSPMISTADQYQAQQALKPIIEQINRQGNGR